MVCCDENELSYKECGRSCTKYEGDAKDLKGCTYTEHKEDRHVSFDARKGDFQSHTVNYESKSNVTTLYFKDKKQ